ncbi:sensor histidine kinase [Nitrococcus mobilis]|uniref:histidine kinase n=1 Tax=Nitrococcus mobilis Nb-231 TaxID=314278 RepID=A4BPD5_9GAMM|nr:ATP-binding protein [Nitrococcus mobilis]EAR22436.1 sensory transduction histidine kinase [Nitrococcus mobilis Nb-231]
MKLYHPRSTLTLILYGFGVVSLPLFFALAYAGVYVDRLSEQAQTAVYNAAQAIQGSRSLAEALTGMERTARQYLLLGDQSLFKVYKETHDEFQSIVNHLSILTATAPHRHHIDDIGRQETELFQRVSDENARQQMTQQKTAAIFITLHKLADQISRGSNRQIDHEVQVMQQTATMAQRVLFWLAIALIPLTLISTAIFTVLISRPVRQVDNAIRKLGAGRFGSPIEVSGPQDLHALGERLEWLRRRLIELEGEKTRFLRHVSHELKTPLTTIRESTALLEDEVVGRLNDEQREITQILYASGHRLQILIEDLLDFSRMQAHRPALNLTPVDMSTLVENVLQNHKVAIKAKSLLVTAKLAECRLLGDAGKLRTVVDNLLSNAIKFSPTHGALTIRTLQLENTVVLDVADQGPGITAAERDRVFEAFFQGKRQPEGYVKGSGLGLSIAREYVLAHDGRIDVLDRPSSGARLRVMLPSRANSKLAAVN